MSVYIPAVCPSERFSASRLDRWLKSCVPFTFSNITYLVRWSTDYVYKKHSFIYLCFFDSIISTFFFYDNCVCLSIHDIYCLLGLMDVVILTHSDSSMENLISDIVKIFKRLVYILRENG